MTDTWTTDVHPGYRTKVVKIGSATVEINRPILDAAEQARRKNQVEDALRHFGRAMYANQQERSVRHE